MTGTMCPPPRRPMALAPRDPMPEMGGRDLSPTHRPGLTGGRAPDPKPAGSETKGLPTSLGPQMFGVA